MHEKIIFNLQSSIFNRGLNRSLPLLGLLLLAASCASEFDGLYTPGLIISATATPTATAVADPCDSTASPFGYGSGTVGDPYLICSRAHLAAIAAPYLSSYFKQTQNIDLGGVTTPWAPIAATAFTGTFDGNSKTISNLYYNTAGVSDVGLFKLVTTSAVIKNVILTGVNITGTGSRTAALVGRLTASTIQNCTAAGSVSGAAVTGGLVGLAETASAITSSSTAMTVTASAARGAGLVANVTGDSTITSSYATGTVSGTTMVGGLVGTIIGTAANNQITSSYATGNVTGSSTHVGGLVATLTTAGILSSYATGNVTGTRYVGGLVGNVATTSVITSSYYTTGTVTAPNNSTEVGGLLGILQNSTVSKSYSTGTVASANTTPSFVGGLIGDTTGATILNSYSQGSITGSPNDSGGLVGRLMTSTLTNSYSSGLVTFTNSGGGLIGIDGGGNTINTSYWDQVSSGQAASNGGTGMAATALMKDFNNFIGWDFAAIWNGAGYGGSAVVYPYLR